MPASVTARQVCRTVGCGLVVIPAVGSIGLAAAKVTRENAMGAPRSRNGLRRMPASCGPWPAGRWLSRSPLVERPRMLDVSVRRGRGTVQAVLQLEEDPHPGPCAAPAPMPSSPPLPLPLHRRTTPPPSHLALGDPTRRCCHACGPCVTSRGSRSGASDDETSGMDAGAWPCACRLRNLGGEPTVAPSAPRSCLLAERCGVAARLESVPGRHGPRSSTSLKANP